MLFFAVTLLAMIHATLAASPFGSFFDMFGQQGEYQQQAPPQGHSPSMWAAQADAVGCSKYLCPSTLVCVENPTSCPCPSTQDVKCVIPDTQTKSAGTVLCISGPEGCGILERFSKL